MRRLMAILFAAILSFAFVLMPTFLEARGGCGGHGGGGHRKERNESFLLMTKKS